MSDQTTPGEMPNTTPGEKPELPAEPKAGVTPPEPSVDLEALQRSLKNKEEENIRIHKKLEAFEQAEQKRKEAEMSEMEKLQAQFDKAQNELKQLRINELKRQAATKFKLPDALALRLQGETLEELEADAETLSKTLPKGPPKLDATNPNGGLQKKTDDQIRAEIYGDKQALFTQGWNEEHGGGVFTVNKED